jgi:hypothetical protein
VLELVARFLLTLFGDDASVATWVTVALLLPAAATFVGEAAAMLAAGLLVEIEYRTVFDDNTLADGELFWLVKELTATGIDVAMFDEAFVDVEQHESVSWWEVDASVDVKLESPPEDGSTAAASLNCVPVCKEDTQTENSLNVSRVEWKKFVATWYPQNFINIGYSIADGYWNCIAFDASWFLSPSTSTSTSTIVNECEQNN